jgi:hypothetical protein
MFLFVYVVCVCVIRSAVMIGTALKQADMGSIVAKLGTIEQVCRHRKDTA